MRGTPLRSLGRSLQAFEARTVPRVYANILVSRGLREPFRGRWFCSEISPEGTFHRKRPKVPRTRPSLDRCKIFCAVTPWPLLSKNRRLKAVSAKVSSARGSLHVEGVAGRNLEAQRRPAASKEPAVPRYAAESGVCRWRPIRSLPGSVTAFGPAPSRVIKGHRKGAAECTARGPAPGTSSRCASRPGACGAGPADSVASRRQLLILLSRQCGAAKPISWLLPLPFFSHCLLHKRRAPWHWAAGLRVSSGAAPLSGQLTLPSPAVPEWRRSPQDTLFPAG